MDYLNVKEKFENNKAIQHSLKHATTMVKAADKVSFLLPTPAKIAVKSSAAIIKAKEQRKKAIEESEKGTKELVETQKQKNSLYAKLKSDDNKVLGLLALGGIILFTLPKLIQESIQNININVGGIQIGGGDVYGMSCGKTSEQGVRELMNTESFDEVAVDREKDGILTIGYGHKGKEIKPGQRITREAAFKLFQSDLVSRERVVNQMVKVPLTQNMFDALVSFVYNCGSGNFARSDTLKLLNQGKYREAAERMKTEYINKGTRMEQGLRNRRAREAAKILGDLDVSGAIKGDIINQTYTVNTSLGTKIGSTAVNMGSIDRAYRTNDNRAYSYSKQSHITSRTKLKSGYNALTYNSAPGTFGTWKDIGSGGKTRSITSGIGHRTEGSKFHMGIDIGYGEGEPVRSFCGGVLIHAGSGRKSPFGDGALGGFGYAVLIRDSNGYVHLYGHMKELQCASKLNTYIPAGTLLGKASGTGGGGGAPVVHRFNPHLHYSIVKPGCRYNAEGYVDPRTYLYNDKDLLQQYVSTNKIIDGNYNQGNSSDKKATAGNGVKPGSKPPPKTPAKPNTANKSTTIKTPPKSGQQKKVDVGKPSVKKNK